MNRYLLPSLFAVSALYAQASEPMADASERLLSALEKEVEALEQIQKPEDATEVLGELRDALKELEAMAASVDDAELWQYIENTEGVKQPLVDILSQLALQMARIEEAAYFNHSGLQELLAPQTEETPEVQNAKLEKIRAVDYDDE
ncbi:MAG: hypothetical protein IKV13_04940 [Akkermansia sp.]|nr:hypothetical protein [Akkermansia sp.]